MHNPDPARSSHPHAAAIVQRWTVAVLSGLGLILALIIIATLSVGGLEKTPAPIKQILRVSSIGPVEKTLDLSISPGIKPGPDGKLHDAWSVTTFHVHAGQAMTLVIDNTDTVPHGMFSPAAGVRLVVRPGVHRYTLLVNKRGSFAWNCNFPCDPFSMMTPGYMMGTIISD